MVLASDAVAEVVRQGKEQFDLHLVFAALESGL
jgi:hypothetical protein